MTLYVVVLALLLAALAWFFFSGRNDAPEPTAHRRATDDIDYAELEEAERDVQDATDENDVQDWGPGTPRPPHGV